MGSLGTMGRKVLNGLAGLALGGLALVGQAAVAAPARPAAAAAASATDDGFRLGSANAPIKLVEYASINCSHCADFDQQAMPMIERAVKAGRLSYEWRPYLIFPHDPAPTLAARCMAPAKAMPFIRAYYAAQGDYGTKWRAALADTAWRTAAQKKIDDGDEPGLSRAVAARLDLAALAAAHGLGTAALDACLGDAATARWLGEAHARAKAAGVSGTPTLFLNGKPFALTSLADLAAAIGEKAPPAPATDAHAGHAH